MSGLSPEFRKLIRWANSAPPGEPAAAPPGWSTRIAARAFEPVTPDLAALWQRAVFASAWAAVAVIVLGLALLNSEKFVPNSPYDLSPAYQVVSTELVP